VVTLEQRRTIVTSVVPIARSERQACRWLGFHRSAVRYTSRGGRDDAGLRLRLRELAGEHPRWGSPMLIWRLRQDGVRDNHKRIRRLYRLEGLAVRRQRRKRVAVPRGPVLRAEQPNEQWAMDFVRDTLSNGRAFRAFTLVDTCTRECLGIEVDVSLGAERVVRVLERLRATRGLPACIVCDNGPEFHSKLLDAWAHQHHVQLQFIRPGKPVETAFIESFNGRLRDECLNQHWFLSLSDARRTIDAWRASYNTARPPRGLAGCPPLQFAEKLQQEQQQRLSA
jgi:putative transposase